jgi:cytosine/adenosine deaminase-related metal-dependent hydrolase
VKHIQAYRVSLLWFSGPAQALFEEDGLLVAELAQPDLKGARAEQGERGEHSKGRLCYAITPRFAPISTDAQLRGAGELAAKYPDVWIQSHLAENKDEIAWARQLFPASRSYLQTYDDFGLLRKCAIYAHCIHLNDDDRALMRNTGAAQRCASPASCAFVDA